MVRATRRPRAVAAANPTTALIQTALEFPLSIDGLHDLNINHNNRLSPLDRYGITHGNDDIVANLM